MLGAILKEKAELSEAHKKQVALLLSQKEALEKQVGLLMRKRI